VADFTARSMIELICQAASVVLALVEGSAERMDFAVRRGGGRVSCGPTLSDEKI
jgi:hypothetical protein